jgi:hypothetical protein
VEEEIVGVMAAVEVTYRKIFTCLMIMGNFSQEEEEEEVMTDMEEVVVEVSLP